MTARYTVRIDREDVRWNRPRYWVAVWRPGHADRPYPQVGAPAFTRWGACRWARRWVAQDRKSVGFWEMHV